MTNLFILNETFTNGLNYGIVDFISLASILCGIFVIISKNPIVLFLIGFFLIFHYILGQVYAIHIIAIAGAVPAIGLNTLVAFFRLRRIILFYYKKCQL